MLDLHKDIFTQRQTMERTDFECYHYLDVVPPEVDFHEHAFYEIFFFLSGEVSYSIEGRTYRIIGIFTSRTFEKAGRMNAL